MKLSNRIYVNGFVNSLNKLLDEPLAPMQAFILAKLAKQIQDKSPSFEKGKLKVYEKYGKKEHNKEGQEIYNIPKSKIEPADKELSELLDLEEEYDLPKKIVLHDDVKISGRDAVILEDILEFNIS